MTDAPDWEGFGRDLMQDWPTGDIEGSELFEAALRNGLVREIPGGYDPEQHIDAEGICPETGDPWYEYAFSHTRADLEATASPFIANPLKKKKADRDGYDQFWAALEPATPLDDLRVKALPKPSVAEWPYWTVCPKVLEEIRQDAGEWAGEAYLQTVEAIALAVVRRVDALSALKENK